MSRQPGESAGVLATVVVPMYGVRDYIGECLQSISDQTIADRLHVVLIDDGSVDGTGDIAARFVVDRPGWHLIRQPNGGPGPGAARNRGLAEARGPFVLFCDGDDVLEHDAMERLVEAATRTVADVVVGAARQIPTPRTWLWSRWFEPLDGAVLTGTVADFPELVHHPAPGDKLFRTDFLRRHELRFGERIHHQDTLVSVPALLLPSRLAVLRHVVQRYRRRDDGTSIMDGHYTRIENTWDHLSVIQRLAELRPQLDEDRVALLNAFLVRSFQGFLARAALLPRSEAEGLFFAARQVYHGVPPSLVLEMTDGAVHALPYRAVLTDDLTSFLDPTRGVKAFDLSGTRLRLDVEVEPPWSAALELGRLRGVVTGLDVEGDDLVVSGTVRVSGSPSLEVLGAQVCLRLRGAAVTVPVHLTPEEGAAALTVSRFVARVPTSRLQAGHLALRVVLAEGEAQRSGRMALDPVSSRTVTTPDGLRVTAALDDHGAAVLTVTEAQESSAGRLRARSLFRRITG